MEQKAYIDKLLKILGATDVWLLGNKIFGKQFIANSPYKTDLCLKFTVQQFNLFTDDVKFNKHVALVKSKRSTIDVPGEISEAKEPQVQTRDVDIDFSWHNEFKCPSKELFILPDAVASPSQLAITYVKQKNSINCIVQSAILDCYKLDRFKVKLRENLALVLQSKNAIVQFPFISSEIPPEAVSQVISNCKAIGKIVLPPEVAADMKKLPAKADNVIFTKNKLVVDSPILKYEAKINTQGDVNATALMSSVDWGRMKMLVTQNALMYKLSDKVYKIVQLLV